MLNKLIIIFALILTEFNCTFTTETNDLPVENEKPINKTLMLQLVNTQRSKGCTCGTKFYPAVQKLVWNETLEKVALLHSDDMAKNNYFSHTGKDGSSTPQRMQRLGYNWMSYGENIYRTMGYSATEEEVVNAWIKSPGHCANLMGEHFKEMGIARTNDYWTQVFGSQMPK